MDVTCGRLVYRDLGGRLTRTVPLTEEVHVSIKGKKGYGFWFHCSFVRGLCCASRNGAWTRPEGRRLSPTTPRSIELFGPLTTRWHNMSVQNTAVNRDAATLTRSAATRSRNENQSAARARRRLGE